MNRCAGNDLLGALVAMVGVGLICARLLSFNGWLAFLGGARDRDWRGERGIFQRPA